MRRALTILTLPILLLSAWDSVPKTRERLALWSRMRERHRVPPDAAWDRVYAGLVPYLPPRGRVGLVQVLPGAGIPPVSISAIYLERRYLPLRIRMFIDTIAEAIGASAPTA